MRIKIAFFAVLSVFFLNTCEKPDNSADPQEPGNPQRDTLPYGFGAVNGSSELLVRTVAQNRNTPWGMTFTSNGRIFFTERRGLVHELLPDGSVREVLNFTSQVAAQGESGLLGIAADPDFSANAYLYIAYSYATPTAPINNRLVRLRWNGGTNQYVQDIILIDNIRGQANHSGGGVKFGPDGKLYWTMGDRFEPNLAQDPSSLHGKILRLNKDGSVPADNPFPGSYIWSLGHRNPQGLAWQPGTNMLYSTEHGPSGGFPECCNDEVNRVEKGKNYGWPLIRGDQQREGMIAPAWFSGPNTTWAPGGATFVRQGKWQGSLLFTGLRGRALYRAVFDSANPQRIIRVEEYFKDTYGRLREVAQAPDGTIYLCTSNRDGRGSPIAADDRILAIEVK